MPDAWQAWLYRAKQRAYLALLERNGTSVLGQKILDFGCGSGFFEDLWQRKGAREVAGIDIAANAIERLRELHPERRYLCADLAAEQDVTEGMTPYDIVTAIDVLYHVVDDAQVTSVLGRLLPLVARGGAFVFSDALVEARPGEHVHFRRDTWWRETLAQHGFEIIDREPVAYVHNRPSVAARILPNTLGAAQYYADVLARRLLPGRANNWAVLARRMPGRNA